MPRLFVFCVVLTIAVSTAFSEFAIADVVISEEVDFGGDFSNDPLAPTELGTFDVGLTTVNGLMFNLFFYDPDAVTFSIAPGTQLEAIWLDSLDSDGHFFAFDDGQQAVDPNMNPYDGSLTIARLVSGSDIGSNLLGPVPPGQGNFNTSNDPVIAGPGDYTVWIQELVEGDVYGYSMTFEVGISAVPEPSAAAFMLAIGSGLTLRRRRRAH